MTRKLFWANPYLTSITTTITALQGTDVCVADTILYAFSGGQESDTGSIADRAVLHAQKEGKQIRYTLADTTGLQVGDHVCMLIDWERRYRLMRLHFAAEIVLELVVQHVQGIVKIGAHIAEDKARIDFLLPQSIAPTLPTLQAQAQALIDSDAAIISAFSDEENERRYWRIEGFAQVSCGGTHIRHTDEVGKIELKRKNVGKGKERIEIFASP
jgi:Ser-tRNA(Ala) deacylase AlaX